MSPNFLRTGDYRRSFGYINNRTADGYWWSDTNSPIEKGHYLAVFIPGNIEPQRSNYRGYGFAIRCVVREG